MILKLCSSLLLHAVFFIFPLKPYQARRRQKKSYNVRGSERFSSTPAAGNKTASSLFICMFLLLSESAAVFTLSRQMRRSRIIPQSLRCRFSSTDLMFSTGGGGQHNNNTRVQLLPHCLQWKPLMKRFPHAVPVHVCGGQRSHRACSKAAAARRGRYK